MCIKPGDLVTLCNCLITSGWAHIPTSSDHDRNLVITFESAQQLGIVVCTQLRDGKDWAYVMTSTASSWFMSAELESVND